MGIVGYGDRVIMQEDPVHIAPGYLEDGLPEAIGGSGSQVIGDKISLNITLIEEQSSY
jgi:hypothetical protein